MPIREFDLIERIRRFAGRGRGVLVGVGDDTAVLSRGRGRLLATTDALVAGVDFTPDERPESVGRKAANVNFSDIAAMGGAPRFVLATLCLPPGIGARWGERVMRGVVAASRAGGASLVGGDLSATSGPAIVSVTALGEAVRPVLRSGARPGDAIGVTGACGGSILGRHLTFHPRVAEGRRLARFVHAMVDVSDGLAADLGHILDASGVGADLESSALPVHADARRVAKKSGRGALLHALSDGEDFELLFTCASGRFPRWAHRIGVITKKRGLRMDGKALKASGYEHVLG
jgi:thiamine-monophosphate kinase